MIVADADFLSAFLKINRLELVFRALETTEIVIAAAVLHEIEQAPVYGQLLNALQSTEQKITVREVASVESDNFGRGEIESIMLAQNCNGLLLMNDRKAAKFAENSGVTVIDIPVFLLHCKTNNYISHEELIQIMKDLKEKDYYEFSDDVKRTLIS